MEPPFLKHKHAPKRLEELAKLCAGAALLVFVALFISTGQFGKNGLSAAVVCATTGVCTDSNANLTLTASAGLVASGGTTYLSWSANGLTPSAGIFCFGNAAGTCASPSVNNTYQQITTGVSNAQSVTPFTPAGGGSYLLVANGSSGGSPLYKWMTSGVNCPAGGGYGDGGTCGGIFYTLTSSGARNWDTFTVGGVTYLIVSNNTAGNFYVYKWTPSGAGCPVGGAPGDGTTCGVIYQTISGIPSAVNAKVFINASDSKTYAALSNGSTYIYQWMSSGAGCPTSGGFGNGASCGVNYQTLTSGSTQNADAIDIGGVTYLLQANYNIHSRIYKWTPSGTGCPSGGGFGNGTNCTYGGGANNFFQRLGGYNGAQGHSYGWTGKFFSVNGGTYAAIMKTGETNEDGTIGKWMPSGVLNNGEGPPDGTQPTGCFGDGVSTCNGRYQYASDQNWELGIDTINVGNDLYYIDGSSSNLNVHTYKWTASGANCPASGGLGDGVSCTAHQFGGGPSAYLQKITYPNAPYAPRFAQIGGDLYTIAAGGVNNTVYVYKNISKTCLGSSSGCGNTVQTFSTPTANDIEYASIGGADYLATANYGSDTAQLFKWTYNGNCPAAGGWGTGAGVCDTPLQTISVTPNSSSCAASEATIQPNSVAFSTTTTGETLLTVANSCGTSDVYKWMPALNCFGNGSACATATTNNYFQELYGIGAMPNIAKSTQHFTIGGTDYLTLVRYVPTNNYPSYLYKWTPSPTTVQFVSSSGSQNSGNITYIERTMRLDPGRTVLSIGVYQPGAGSSVTIKIFKRNSVGNYDVVYNQGGFTHSGGGWQNFTLSSPYTVPATGDYYYGFWTNQGAYYSFALPGFGVYAAKSGDATGNGAIFSDGAGANFLMRVNYNAGGSYYCYGNGTLCGIPIQDIYGYSSNAGDHFAVGGTDYFAQFGYTNNTNYLFKWISGLSCFGNGTSCSSSATVNQIQTSMGGFSGTTDFNHFQISGTDYFVVARQGGNSSTLLFKWTPAGGAGCTAGNGGLGDGTSCAAASLALLRNFDSNGSSWQSKYFASQNSSWLVTAGAVPQTVRLYKWIPGSTCFGDGATCDSYSPSVPAPYQVVTPPDTPSNVEAYTIGGNDYVAVAGKASGTSATYQMLKTSPCTLTDPSGTVIAQSSSGSSLPVGPITGSAIYTLTCTLANGSQSVASVQVGVILPPSTSVTATPTTIASGASSNITWTSSSINAGSCGINRTDPGGSVSVFSMIGAGDVNSTGVTTGALNTSGNYSYQSTCVSPYTSGLNGTIVGSPSAGTGKIAQDYVLNGTNQYISVPNSASLNIAAGGSVTMCAWINSTTGSTGTYRGVLAKRDTSGTPYAYGINFGTNNFQVYTSGASGVRSFGYNLPANTWTHICGVISASPTALYVNGALFGTLGTGGGVAVNTAPLTIGGSTATVEPFNGAIDDVRLYNRVLSASEIATLAASGHVSSGLIGYWPLDTATVSGTTAYDETGGIITSSSATVAVSAPPGVTLTLTPPTTQTAGNTENLKWTSTSMNSGSCSINQKDPANIVSTISAIGGGDNNNVTGLTTPALGSAGPYVYTVACTGPYPSGNNGTLVGSPTTDSTPGSGQALAFNGSTQYITMGTGALTSIDTSDKTVSAWIKPSGSTNNPQGIIDKDFDLGYPTQGGWGFWMQSNGKLWWWDTTSLSTADLKDDGAASAPTGSWSFVTAVWHASTKTVDFYINGVLNSSKTNNTIVEKSSSSAQFLIGSIRNGASSYSFGGSIDDVRVYNRALSPAEVSTLNSTGQVFSGLVGYWPLDTGTISGTTVYDIPSTTGRLTGSPTTGVVGNTGLGQAVTFGGNNDFLTLLAPVSLSTSWTISTWFKAPLPTTPAGWRTLTRSTTTDHQVIVNSAGVLGMYDNAGATGFHASPYTSMNSIAAGWHHLAAVGSGSATTYYIDGVSVGSANLKSSANIGYIGNYQGGSQQFGTIDDFRIYNRALSADEVSTLATRGTIINGLVNYWPFDTSTNTVVGTTAYDEAGFIYNDQKTVTVSSSAPPPLTNCTTALGTPAGCNLFLSATRVRSGANSQVSWSVTGLNASMNCSITSSPTVSGLPAAWNHVSNTNATTYAGGPTSIGPITKPTVVTLSCDAGGAPSIVQKTITLIPAVQEI